MEFCKTYGVSAVFEAGTPGGSEFHEHVYDVMKKMDENGELPIIVDCNYSICTRDARNGLMDMLKRWWHYGDSVGGARAGAAKLLGEERADQMYRCKSDYNTGANVCFSCDTTAFYFDLWSPYLGMEIAATRRSTDQTKVSEILCPHSDVAFPGEKEKMTVEESILCYTINNAKQLCIDDTKGSIEVGKDANLVVLKDDIFAMKPEDIWNIDTECVYFEGTKSCTI